MLRIINGGYIGGQISITLPGGEAYGVNILTSSSFFVVFFFRFLALLLVCCRSMYRKLRESTSADVDSVALFCVVSSAGAPLCAAARENLYRSELHQLQQPQQR